MSMWLILVKLNRSLIVKSFKFSLLVHNFIALSTSYKEYMYNLYYAFLLKLCYEECLQ